MKEISAQKKNFYLINRGHNCPICHSENIEGEGVKFDFEDNSTEECRCLDCESEWLDTYNIVDVKLTKEGKKKGKGQNVVSH